MAKRLQPRFSFEALIWALALAGAALLGPAMHDNITLCVPTLLGFDGCWGCGLGIGIAETLRGNFAAGFDHHPFAWLAIVVLSLRIVQLTFTSRTFAGDYNG
jgi:hypothetical protein